jgi:GGDEF domain-containing protein
MIERASAPVGDRAPTTATGERRRALLAADGPVWTGLVPTTTALRPTWEIVWADSFEQARFLLQMHLCHVLILDASLYQLGDADGVAWLAAVQREPVVFLADERATLTLDAVQQGANYWMPRDLAAACPPLLGELLDQALEFGALQQRLSHNERDLAEGRRQVDRLLGLLWDAAPTEGRGPWFTQRHMMERLQEELARTRRRGGPLAVVLGEAHVEEAASAVEEIVRLKRRCDVAGQYGPHGFMLLLPRTTDEEAVGCCRRLQAGLEARTGGAFFGVASYSPAAPSAQALLRRAEERLERAKGQGAGLVTF